ncbi:MAG: hypothetical protein ACK56I_32050, partial [bacterium]
RIFWVLDVSIGYEARGLQVEVTGFEVGGECIVTEVAESASDTDLCESSFAPTANRHLTSIHRTLRPPRPPQPSRYFDGPPRLPGVAGHEHFSQSVRRCRTDPYPCLSALLRGLSFCCVGTAALTVVPLPCCASISNV